MINNIMLNKVASYNAATTLTTDKKVNIIYGLNGTGKSTFSNYFYNPDNPAYQHCSHQGQYDSILVYNQTFIQEYFHAKDSINGIFSLSKENKAANEKIEQINLVLESIEKDIAVIQDEISIQQKAIAQAKEIAINKVWEIKNNYSGGDRVLEFCLKGKMGSKEGLYTHLASMLRTALKPTKTIENLKDEANAIRGDEAAKHNTLVNIGTMELPAQDSLSLNEIIVGSKDSPVSKLIEKLNNSSWVSDGLKFLSQIDGPQCPFCQAETITENLTQQIHNYFDESYQEGLVTINAIHARYTALINTIPSLDYYKSSTFAGDDLLALSEHHAKLHKDMDANLDRIAQKVANPSIQIELSDVGATVTLFNQVIDLINTKIIEHNNKIDNVAKELEKIKRQFWEIVRYEYDLTIAHFNGVVAGCNKIIDSKKLEEEGKKQQKMQNEKNRIFHQRSTVNIEESIININNGLKDIGITEFFLDKHEEHNYRLVRNNSREKIFSSLSEGEKMIISFLYFRELFKGKQSATEGQLKKIAIIDDPVSSMSHIYMYNIGRLIQRDFFRSDNVAQVFVLTHSLYFFYELTDTNKERRAEGQNLFRLSKNSSSSTITTMKYEEVQNDYQSYWSIINDDQQPAALIANCMRNIIEYFFNFVQKSDLSNVVQHPKLQEIRLQAFCRYINRESHSLGQNIYDFKEFNYSDFKEGLRLVFELTGYPEHYKKMAKIPA